MVEGSKEEGDNNLNVVDSSAQARKGERARE